MAKHGAVPATLPEKIICDADTYYFGTIQFRQTAFLFKMEMKLRTRNLFPDWLKNSLRLLQIIFSTVSIASCG